MNYLIIGGGPAAVNAAATLRRIDEKSRVTVISREKKLPYARIALPWLISGAVSEELLSLPIPAEVDFHTDEEAVEIEVEKHQVKTASGRLYLYDRMLITSGAAAQKPNIPGNHLPFVRTIREITDVGKLQKLLKVKKTGRALVAGAGPVGLELADVLHRLGYKITLVISSARVFSTMLDEAASAFLERRLIDRGVEIFKSDDIVEISASGEAFLRSGRTLSCDLLIFGKGIAPCIDYLIGSGIQTRQGIPVNRHQQTNIPHIYAAGDVAETWDITSEAFRINALWPEALEQGKVAALNMASLPAAYPGSFPRNTMRVFDTSIHVAGISGTEDFEVYRESSADYYRKVVLKEGILKGFIFLGEARNVGLYCNLIRRQVKVGSSPQSFLHGNYSHAHFLHWSTRL